MGNHLVHLLKEGTVTFQKVLFQKYKLLGLTDIQFLILLHLQVFEQEGKSFPTVSELENRMHLSSSQIIVQMQALLKNGYITIEQDYDALGKLVEKYNLFPLYEKLADSVLSEKPTVEPTAPLLNRSLFSIFEQEFGRPLSPLEYEQINLWIDQDRYSDELIFAALRESAISGKLNFRYIDRILLEWAKNNIRTEEDAKIFSLRFREKQYERKDKAWKVKGSEKVEVRFPQFNWLEK